MYDENFHMGKTELTSNFAAHLGNIQRYAMQFKTAHRIIPKVSRYSAGGRGHKIKGSLDGEGRE